MSSGTFIDAWINPLAFHHLDEPWASKLPRSAEYKDFLWYLCTPGVSSDLDQLTARYEEISKERRLFAAPAERDILEKLVWPLRHAKASYMVGNTLGTISLCGMVSEMVAILFYEISETSFEGRPIDEDAEKLLFGSKFERLGQDRRVRVLRGLRTIDDETASLFDTVREIRRRYLHLYSQEHASIDKDAVRIFHAVAELIARLIGQDIEEGKILLNPKLLKYLERKGIVRTEVTSGPVSPD